MRKLVASGRPGSHGAWAIALASVRSGKMMLALFCLGNQSAALVGMVHQKHQPNKVSLHLVNLATAGLDALCEPGYHGQ